MSPLRQLALRALTGRGVSALYRPLMRGRATILMLHRLRDPALGIPGDDPAELRRCLAWLRRMRYRLIDLEALIDGLAAGDPACDRAVAFTIDDGYRDQAAIGASLFAEFDCPVTTFVTSGFLDGKLWFWWDQIEYVFARSEQATVVVRLGADEVRYQRTADGYRSAQADFTERCKREPDAAMRTAVGDLAAAAGVTIPAAPPVAYAPMTWDELRACERRGMRFGPHTVTHPVLSRATDDQSRFEIMESWRRVRAEAQHPVPVFCYPNGQVGDFGDREIANMRDAGIKAAVVGSPGYADRRTLASTPAAPYLIPRFGYTADHPVLRQYVSGLEYLKSMARGAA